MAIGGGSSVATREDEHMSSLALCLSAFQYQLLGSGHEKLISHSCLVCEFLLGNCLVPVNRILVGVGFGMIQHGSSYVLKIFCGQTHGFCFLHKLTDEMCLLPFFRYEDYFSICRCSSILSS